MFELTKEAIVGFNKSIHIHLYFRNLFSRDLRYQLLVACSQIPIESKFTP